MEELEEELISSIEAERIVGDDYGDVEMSAVEGPERNYEKTNCYVRLLANYPYVIPALVVGIMAMCGGLAYKFHPPPDFSKDPTAGFETRGTYVSNADITLRNLVDNVGKSNSEFSFLPNISLAISSATSNLSVIPAEILSGFFQLAFGDSNLRLKRSGEDFAGAETSDGFRQKPKGLKVAMMQKKLTKRNIRSGISDMEQLILCSYVNIDVRSPKFVFESDSHDLLTAPAIRAMCLLEKRLQWKVTPPLPSDLGLPCPLQSISSYVLAMSGLSDCSLLTDDHVNSIKRLLAECLPHYLNKTLPDYSLGPPPSPSTSGASEGAQKNFVGALNPACTLGAYVYKIFYYLADKNFLREGSLILKHAVAYLPPAAGTIEQEETFYVENMEGREWKEGDIRLVGIEFGNQLRVKDRLFGSYVFSDLKYFGVAFLLVFLVMLLYLRSFVVMIATLLNVIFSFLLAYFLYFFVLRFEFFPFIGVLSGLVLIAIGADDVFVLCDAWEREESRNKNPTSDTINPTSDTPQHIIISRAFSHAALSIFVTSLTTASSFFANSVSSSITAIRCFGVFAGLAVLCNFLLVITWTSSVIALTKKLSQKFQESCWKKNPRDRRNGSVNCRCWESFAKCLGKIATFLYGRLFPAMIAKAWFAWMVILVALSVGSCMVIFVSPKFELPKTKDFQVFPSSNLLERFDLGLDDEFQATADRSASRKLLFTFLWGFKPIDDGNWLDPEKPGRGLYPDESFDMGAPESQFWMTEFCHDLKNQTFVTRSSKRAECGFESYRSLLGRYCGSGDRVGEGGEEWGGGDMPYRYVFARCCEEGLTKTTESESTPSTSSRFIPFSPSFSRACEPALRLLQLREYSLNGFIGSNVDLAVLGSPVNDRRNKVVGYAMRFYSDLYFSTSYTEMNAHFRAVKSFLDQHLATAPPSLSPSSAFVSAQGSFEFYDIQDTIASGTYYSVALSVLVAFVVMLCTSLNPLLTLYAMLTIAGAIACTVASLALLGWELNVVESVVISLAVGMSIDFTIHYGMAYRQSTTKPDPKARVRESFASVGPAVAAAALTTLVSGLAVLPCHVLVYVKLGTFLVLVMTFSWIYSTFLFQSLCYVIGPWGGFCQVSAACWRRRCNRRWWRKVITPSFVEDSVLMTIDDTIQHKLCVVVSPEINCDDSCDDNDVTLVLA